MSVSNISMSESGSNIKLEAPKLHTKSGEITKITYKETNGTINSKTQETETLDLDNEIVFGKVKLDKNAIKEGLIKKGLQENDIDRIVSGEITFQELMQEMQQDTTNSRRKQMMEASILSSFNLEFTNIEQLENASKSLTIELENIRNEKSSNEVCSKLVDKLIEGESLESILKSTYEYEYTDLNGNTCYKSTIPNQYEALSFRKITYEEALKDNEIYQELASILEEKTIDPLFLESYTAHLWTGTQNQTEAVNKLKGIIEKQEEEIGKLEEQKQLYDYVIENSKQELDYYMKNIDAYIYNKDFSSNNNFNSKCLEKVEQIKKQYEEIEFYDYSSGLPTVNINNKQELVDIISCIINGEGEISNGCLKVGTTMVELSSSDDLLRNYEKWGTLFNDTEKKVFNYIFNTKGYDAAYDYLQSISSTLDNRWVTQETLKDQEWASNHHVLASAYSIVAAPVEGLSAIANSVSALLEKEEIRKTNTYSSSDVYRSQVSSDIDRDYGHIASFWYNTGMSMADSAVNTALIIGTGGTGAAAGIISATTMGSRAYVSTLNDALDRGLDDKDAVCLAFASSAAESAMESFSAGHLLKMDSILSSKATPFATKIAEKISDPLQEKIARNLFKITYGAVSQGLCEGEEEVSTEILNFLCDEIISGDLSSYSLDVKNYLNLGYNEEEAQKLALKDFQSQLQQAFLGGFASGMTFGLIGSGVSSYNDYKKNSISKELATSIQAEYQEKGIKLVKKEVESLISPTVKSTMESLKKTTLGTLSSFPATINKIKTSPLSSNRALLNKCSTEGLVHITSEEATNKILSSGYVKASGNPITSYGSAKAFFFAGIPSFEEVCLNLNTYHEKATAVRIKPSVEALYDSKFQYRSKDDFAIAHKGDYYFEPGSAEVIYLGLDTNENGEFYYKEISKEEYENYTLDTNNIKKMPQILKKLSNNLKSISTGLAYQYDILMHKVDKLNELSSTDSSIATGQDTQSNYSKNNDMSLEKILDNLKDKLPEKLDLTRADINATLEFISLGAILDLVVNEDAYNKFLDFENNKEYFKYPSNRKYLKGVMELVHASKKNNIDLGLNEEQQIRLDNLYTEALNNLNTNDISYSEYLPDNQKIMLILENKTIYEANNLNIISSYFHQTMTEDFLNEYPTAVLTDSFQNFITIVNQIPDSIAMTNEYNDFLNSIYTKLEKGINEIVKNNLEINEIGFRTLLSSITNWTPDINEYVNNYIEHNNVDLSKIKYDIDMSDKLKLKLIVANNELYDWSDFQLIYDYAINEFTEEKIEANPSLLLSDEFQFCLNKFNKVINLNKDGIILNYGDITFNKYLELNRYLQDLRNTINQKVSEKNKSDSSIISKINERRSGFFLKFSHGLDTFFGADQNATRKYSDEYRYKLYNRDWLDTNEFHDFLEEIKYPDNLIDKFVEKFKVSETILNNTEWELVLKHLYSKENLTASEQYQIAKNCFTKIMHPEYVRLKNKLISQGMNENEAIKTLEVIDTVGICTYASIANTILLYFQNDPIGFEETFGYPMYINIDGKTRLNSSELLLDMYTIINSNECGNDIFNLKDGILSINNLDANNQTNLTGGETGVNTSIINTFLKSKGSNLRINHKTIDYWYEPNYDSKNGLCDKEAFESIKNEIINSLTQGKEISLGVYSNPATRSKNKLFRFQKPDGTIYKTIGGGHAITITGIVNNGFEVASWGKRLIIPFEDFIENSFEVRFIEWRNGNE